MKKLTLKSIVTLLTSIISVALVSGQTKPKYDMGVTQMIFLSRSHNWKSNRSSQRLKKKHKAFVESLIRQGCLSLWGEVTGGDDLREIMVINTEFPALAQELVQTLPAFKAGMFTIDIVPSFLLSL